METIDIQKGIREFGAAVKKAGLPGRAILFVLLAGIVFAGAALGVVETNEAGYITIKQSVLTGRVSIITEPGIFCQCFGKITKYKEAGTFMFAHADKAQEDTGRRSPKRGRTADPEVSGEIEVRFNDGGIGWISGMALFDMPKDEESLAVIHTKFRNFENLLEAGIIPTIKESVVLTAALMSSGESYTTKRATFSEWARDQLEKGTYITEETVDEEKDRETGDVLGKGVVRIKTADGSKQRNESPLERYGIKFKQFQITDIRYEPETENIIKTKREALQQTIAAKIAAERSIQERLAAEELGKKNVTVAEYEAMIKKKQAEVEADREKAVALITAQKNVEVAKLEREREIRAAEKKLEMEKIEKNRALVAAQSALEVAKLNVGAAERNKVAYTLEGQGLAENKRLIYNADGALQQKLDAYVKVMSVLAKELGKQKWVPEITMNGGTKGSAEGNAAMNFMDMWMIKTAKELGIEMTSDKKGR